MTKIFRCSFYQSKQPEPPEEEESSAAAAAAWEYVDLEDGHGKHGGGGGVYSDATPKVCFACTITLVMYGILVGCVYLGVAYIYPDTTLAGFLTLFGAGFLLAMAAMSLCGLRPTGSSWWTSTVSQ